MILLTSILIAVVLRPTIGNSIANKRFVNTVAGKRVAEKTSSVNTVLSALTMELSTRLLCNKTQHVNVIHKRDAVV